MDTSIFVAILGVIATCIGVFFQIRKNQSQPEIDQPVTPPIKNNKQTPLNVAFSHFWNYPNSNTIANSWAIKESLVLRDKVAEAQLKPGLGCAIVTTELGKVIGGEKADERINQVIDWAISQTSPEPPFLLRAEMFHPTTSATNVIVDFRHSLAFGIILARFSKMKEYLESYLRLLLETQREDGGWSPGEGQTVSEVFTVLYATELLSLCSERSDFDDETRRQCKKQRSRAFNWLIQASQETGLWNSGVMTEYNWDSLLTSSWLIHRLSVINDHDNEKWAHCLRNAGKQMLTMTYQENTWQNTSEIQKFRVQARIAAAVTRLKKMPGLSVEEMEGIDHYLNSWKISSKMFASSMEPDSWDVGTAAFFLEAFYSPEHLYNFFKTTKDLED